jgi:hypothetical protein
MLYFRLNVDLDMCRRREFAGTAGVFLSRQHTHRTLCYHCEDYMAAFDFLTKVPACSLLLIICDLMGL